MEKKEKINKSKFVDDGEGLEIKYANKEDEERVKKRLEEKSKKK